jgi:hypothetical protein
VHGVHGHQKGLEDAQYVSSNNNPTDRLIPSLASDNSFPTAQPRSSLITEGTGGGLPVADSACTCPWTSLGGIGINNGN